MRQHRREKEAGREKEGRQVCTVKGRTAMRIGARRQAVERTETEAGKRQEKRRECKAGRERRKANRQQEGAGRRGGEVIERLC